MDALATQPQVTVVIPNWNTKHWLRGCLEGLRAQSYQDFQIILVDNGSTDGSLAFVKQHYPEVQILAFATNQGFAPAVNAGIRQSHAKYVALLNVDTIPRPDWLLALVKTMERSPSTVGSLASKMLNLEHPDIIDDAGDVLSWYGSARKRGMDEPADAYDEEKEVFSACAGAALYRRTFLEETGGFDESFGSYLEDIDLGLRGQMLGYRCFFVPNAKVLHHSHGSGLSRSRYICLMTRNRLKLLTKNIPWPLLLKHCRTLIYGQIYFFLVYKRPLHSMAGTISWLITLPHTLRQRRNIQRENRISNQALDALLSNELGEIPLREILRRKVHKGLHSASSFLKRKP